MTRPLVRAVFALLVLATIAAFLVTQQLKSEFPLVLRFAVKPLAFSPNGDGKRDSTQLGFDLSEPARVSFAVMDLEGREVRRLVDERQLAGDRKHRFRWDGRDDAGALVADGAYRMRVVRRDEGRVIDSIKEIRVDRKPPRVRLLSARPGVIAPGERDGPSEVRIRYAGPRNQAPVFRVFRTGDGPARLVLRFRGNDTRSGSWDGRLRDGLPAEPGGYAFTVSVRDRAGNEAVGPVEIPTPAAARAGTGVAVRPLTLSGPLGVVPAGAVARLELGPFERKLEFVLSRYGSPTPVRRGKRVGGTLRIGIPPRARTGVYLVRVRAGGRRAVWPLVVAGLPQSRRAAGRPRPLLVLPALSWQGLNGFDDDLDGFPDTLARSGRVRVERPFGDGRGSPPTFASQTAPLLRFLGRRRLAYDLTTDLALARREGPALGNAPGVAFAGSPLWLPEELERRLRSYVLAGGRVASFGADAFRRRVTLRGEVLRDPSPPAAENAFGERTDLVRTGVAPLSVFEDEARLFEGLTSFVGEFTLFERSAGLPTGSRVLTAAGRESGEPAFVAYKLGKGLVVRSGSPQWARQLDEGSLSVEVPRVSARIWALLTNGP